MTGRQHLARGTGVAAATTEERKHSEKRQPTENLRTTKHARASSHDALRRRGAAADAARPPLAHQRLIQPAARTLAAALAAHEAAAKAAAARRGAHSGKVAAAPGAVEQVGALAFF